MVLEAQPGLVVGVADLADLVYGRGGFATLVLGPGFLGGLAAALGGGSAALLAVAPRAAPSFLATLSLVALSFLSSAMAQPAVIVAPLFATRVLVLSSAILMRTRVGLPVSGSIGITFDA